MFTSRSAGHHSVLQGKNNFHPSKIIGLVTPLVLQRGAAGGPCHALAATGSPAILGGAYFAPISKYLPALMISTGNQEDIIFKNPNLSQPTNFINCHTAVADTAIPHIIKGI